MNKRLRALGGFLLLLALSSLACNLGGGEEEPAALPTSAPVVEEAVAVETVIVVATPTPAPTEEPAAPDVPTLEPQPTPESGSPTMTTLVPLNVRTGPGTNYPVVGALAQGSSVPIVGVSPDGGWWKIQCPSGAGSECWSSAGAAYSTATNAAAVAVAPVPPPPTQVASAPTHTATPTATGTTTVTPTATGTTTVTPTYTPTPPDGPTATYTATPPGGATATYTPTPPGGATATHTPTPQVADFDNDSLQNPAVDIFMSITGTRQFTHSSDISYSQGDTEDWVQFEFPNNSNSSQPVWVTLSCQYFGNVGNAQVRATLYENGQGTTTIAICNNGETQWTVDNTKVQQVRIHFGITNEGVYVTYELRVVGFK